MEKSDDFSRKSAESLMKYDEFLMQNSNDFGKWITVEIIPVINREIQESS